VLRALLLLLFWGVAAVPVALVGFPWTLLTRNIDFLYWLSTGLGFAGVRLAGVRVEIVGRDRLDPRRTYVFMCNHVSNIDPPIVVPLIPRRTSVLVKKELFRVPLLAQAMRLANLVPVDRLNREAAVASVRAAVEVVRAGINMTIFPEGTRSRDGRLLPFEKGPFYLASEGGVPIVPMTLIGTHELWPKGKFALRPGTATLVFHDPIDPAQFSDREQLIAAVREKIRSALPSQYQ